MPDKTPLLPVGRAPGGRVTGSGSHLDGPQTGWAQANGRVWAGSTADDRRTPLLSKCLLAEAGGVKPSEYIPGQGTGGLRGRREQGSARPWFL